MIKSFSLSQVYGLLEPGPVVMLTTSLKGRPNVMTMTWHTMLDFEPPLIGCVISDQDFTFNILKATKECVISIPTVEQVKTVVKVGNTSGRNIDKFKKFSIATKPASLVKAPLLTKCYANVECKVIDTSLAGKYNFFVMKVLKAWVDTSKKNPKTLHHLGNGNFMIAGKTIKLPSKMK